MEKLTVGIIGVGKLGNYHCNNVSQLDEATLAGVYDVDENTKNEIATRYSCTPFGTVDELIAAVDVVGIIVPTSYHLDVAKKVLMQKKPLFVEKPITSTIDQAEELIALAKENNVPVQVGHIERFNPAIQALGDFPLNPLFIESHRLAQFDPRGTDVAVVLDLMIHDIDIILSLVKSPVTAIHANGVKIVSDEIDIANARIQFENGCVANVTASRISQRKMRKMRLFQKEAYVSIDFLQKVTESFQIVDPDASLEQAMTLGQIDKGSLTKNIVYNQHTIPFLDAMQAEWKSFFTSIKNGTTPVVSAQDGLNALKVADEIINTIKNQLDGLNE